MDLQYQQQTLQESEKSEHKFQATQISICSQLPCKFQFYPKIILIRAQRNQTKLLDFIMNTSRIVNRVTLALFHLRSQHSYHDKTVHNNVFYNNKMERYAAVYSANLTSQKSSNVVAIIFLPAVETKSYKQKERWLGNEQTRE